MNDNHHTLSSLCQEISHVSNFKNSNFANFLQECSIRQDDEFSWLEEEHRDEEEAHGPPKRKAFHFYFYLKGKSKKKKRDDDVDISSSSTPYLSAECSKIMCQANSNFVSKNYPAAIDGYLNVIRIAPNTHEAYSTLGIIYKEMGESIKAFNYALISLHLSESDSLDGSCWRKLALEAISLSLSTEAIYCFNRAIRRDWKDISSIWIRMLLFHERRDRRRVADSCVLLLKSSPFHPLILRLLIHIHLALNEPIRLVGILESMLLTSSASISRWTYFHLRFLCRLYVHLNDYGRLFSALPGVIIWMRKSFSDFPCSPLKEDDPVSAIICKESINYEVGTMFCELNSLCSPFDSIFHGSLVNDLPISTSVSEDGSLNIFAYEQQILSKEDRSLRPVDVEAEKGELILADPLAYRSSWFDYMPMDIQAYYLSSAIYANMKHYFEVAIAYLLLDTLESVQVKIRVILTRSNISFSYRIWKVKIRAP